MTAQQTSIDAHLRRRRQRTASWGAKKQERTSVWGGGVVRGSTWCRRTPEGRPVAGDREAGRQRVGEQDEEKSEGLGRHYTHVSHGGRHRRVDRKSEGICSRREAVAETRCGDAKATAASLHPPLFPLSPVCESKKAREGGGAGDARLFSISRAPLFIPALVSCAPCARRAVVFSVFCAYRCLCRPSLRQEGRQEEVGLGGGAGWCGLERLGDGKGGRAVATRRAQLRDCARRGGARRRREGGGEEQDAKKRRRGRGEGWVEVCDGS